jgi:hypothetical protein
MPRGGALTFGDLEGKLEVLRVACTKCDRTGRYHVAKLIERYGPDGSLPEWRHEISKDCPKRANDRVALMDICGAHFPDLADSLSRTSLS